MSEQESGSELSKKRPGSILCGSTIGKREFRVENPEYKLPNDNEQKISK
jgi:hypothetical protein